MTLRLDWLPAQEEVPFYLAAQKGIYEKHGIDVAILDGQGSTATIQQIANKKDTFGYADGGAIVAGVAEHLPIVAIASFYRTSGGVVNVLTSSGIRSPKDLAGKTFAGSPYDAFTLLFPGLLRANGVNPDSVRVINLPPDTYFPALLNHRVDATTGFSWKERILARRTYSADVRPLLYADWGLRLVGFSLIVHPDALASDPDLVRRFVAASVEGWTYAVGHIGEAVSAMRKFRPDDPTPQKVYVQQITADYQTLNLLYSPSTQGRPLGWMSKDDWQSTIDVLFANGVIKTKPAVDKVFTDGFLPAS